MPGEWCDPNQLPTSARGTWSQSLRRRFLRRIQNDVPQVLQDLLGDVLPPYRDFVEQTKSKEVERLRNAVLATVAPNSRHPWESPAVILESLGLSPFKAEFRSWCVRWNLLDAWMQDEAIYRLEVWTLDPESVHPHPIPSGDWSWWEEMESEWLDEIEELKPKDQSKRLRELDKKRKQVEKSRRLIEERNRERDSGHQWLGLGSPHVPTRREDRVYRSKKTIEELPIDLSVKIPVTPRSMIALDFSNLLVAPPELDAWDFYSERWTDYKKRMVWLLDRYKEDSDYRAGALGLKKWDFREGSGDPVAWTVQNRVLGWKYKEITKEKGYKGPKVRQLGDRVCEIVKAIGFTSKRNKIRTGVRMPG